jgi:hypothetical protein
MRRNSKQERDKELRDNARLLRWYKAWHREQRDEALSGPHARTLAELFRMFANLKHVQPTQLAGFIGAIDWSAIDYQTRLTVLHELNSAITRYREKRGLPAIDDSLAGQPESPFRVIKAILFPPPREGAHRGEARPE